MKPKGRAVIIRTDGRIADREIPFPPPKYVTVTKRARKVIQSPPIVASAHTEYYSPLSAAPSRTTVVDPPIRFALVAGTFEVKRPQDLAVYVEVEQ